MRATALLVSAASVVVIGACPKPQPPVIDPIESVEVLTPDRGFTYYIAPFAVPAGVETQDCYFVEVPDINNGGDVWIDRFVIGQRVGSHHMNIFRVNTIVNLNGAAGDVVRGGECRISTNWSDWPLVANSQDSSAESGIVDWVLPEGVAQKFKPGELLMLQSHYVNADIQATPSGGEVRISFYKADDTAPIEMGTLFATQQSIRICQSAETIQSYDGACSFPAGTEIHLAAANGHFHGRGTSLQMYTWDGTSLDHPGADAMFYESLDWNEPPMDIDLDAVVPSGGGIWWTCNYQWRPPAGGCDLVNERDDHQQGDCCYTFGNSAENAEHCNIFVYYWPKTESDIFCN